MNIEIVNFANIILFFCSVVGLTNILIDSSLFGPFRNLMKSILPNNLYIIFECPQCMGTWAGFLCGLILVSNNLLVVMCCGFAGSYINVLSYNINNYIESKTISLLEVDDE
jgi:hypothetical protein